MNGLHLILINPNGRILAPRAMTRAAVSEPHLITTTSRVCACVFYCSAWYIPGLLANEWSLYTHKLHIPAISAALWLSLGELLRLMSSTRVALQMHTCVLACLARVLVGWLHTRTHNGWMRPPTLAPVYTFVPSTFRCSNLKCCWINCIWTSLVICVQIHKSQVDRACTVCVRECVCVCLYVFYTSACWPQQPNEDG